MVSKLFGILVLLLAATSAQAQTNPLGAGYSLANGELFVQISSSLNSLKLPFSVSFNVVAPTVNGGATQNMFITSTPGGSTAGGFFVGYNTVNSPGFTDTFRLKSFIQPAMSSDVNACSHNGQMCWRFPPIEDGNRHNVCVRWTQTQGFLYVDGVIRDQNPFIGFGYASTTELFWTLGQNAPTTWTMYDARAYAKDIGAAGCNNLALAASQGVYPTTGDLSTDMVLHLPMDSTAGICTNVGPAWTCPDTSGNSNTAVNGSLSPTISIATPSPGTVSGTTSITVSCTIGVGLCSQVCYYLDGYLIAACPTTTSPTYAFSWDTTKAIDGAHVLTAVGYAVSGLTTTSAPVAVTVSNSIGAISYFFDGVFGSDSNDCKAGTTGGGHGPCKTSTKFNSLTYKGGDTVKFNNATTFTSDSGKPPTICGAIATGKCSQNFFASSTPLTVTNYGGGTCNPLTGSSTSIPVNCARIIANAAGTAIQLYNANNVIVENLAFTGNMGAKGIAIDTTKNSLVGGSDGVTIQNNYVLNFSDGIPMNADLAFTFVNQKDNGHITNCLIQDNYVTAPFGAVTSPDAGITTFGGTTCLIQGNVQENAGNSGNDSQGNGLNTQNWPNPGGSTTLNTFQFNVTHDNGGNHNNSVGGPYSLYSIGGDYTLFQFNEQYNQRCWYGAGYPTCALPANYSGIDNGASDVDGGSTHITHQYNYMHDNPMPNSFGLLFFSGNRNSVGGNPGWGDNWYRYNILENNNIGIQDNLANGGITIGVYGTYNNTISSNISNANASTGGGGGFRGTCITSSNHVTNNLCINTATTGWQFYVNQNAPFCTGMDYNDFYSPTAQNYWANTDGSLFVGSPNLNGNTPNGGLGSSSSGWIQSCHAGVHNLNVNPLLVGTPGTGGTCWPGGTTPPAGPQNAPSAANCPAAYQLHTTSPLIGAGVVVDSTPTPNATVDYYGNSVPHGTGSGINIGAYGGTGVP